MSPGYNWTMKNIIVLLVSLGSLLTLPSIVQEASATAPVQPTIVVDEPSIITVHSEIEIYASPKAQEMPVQKKMASPIVKAKASPEKVWVCGDMVEIGTGGSARTCEWK